MRFVRFGKVLREFTCDKAQTKDFHISLIFNKADLIFTDIYSVVCSAALDGVTVAMNHPNSLKY